MSSKCREKGPGRDRKSKLRYHSVMNLRMARLAVASSITLACAPVPQSARIPPAPVLSLWPDPTFLPERQCHGTYEVEDLKRYFPRARLALWLPSTRAVALDAERRCLVVTVESIGAGRLAELMLRGVAVPRRAVLLRLG
jgi:hypothetical protein